MTRSQRTALLLFLLFVVLTPISAQDKKLTMSGIVTDSRSHQPVEGATVSVVGNKANPDTTDRDGNFILTFSASTRAGEVVHIRVQKTGYKVYEVKKPVSPTMPLQFSVDRIAPTAPPRGTSHESTSSRPLPPLIKEEIWSVLIPFNEGDGDPIPAFRMTQADAENFPSRGLFYKRISDWSKSALEGRDRPRTPEAINSFLEEIVRYHVFDWVDQLQHDRYIQSWHYRTGTESKAILANAPPDFVEYPTSKIIDLISNTPLGSVGDVMTYWRSRIFRVPANSTLQFLTTPENGADAYRIRISNPSVFTLTLSVLHGITVLNYGFVPPQFELTPETIEHTRSYNIVVKGRLEFKRFSDTDPLLQDEYVKWAAGLFLGLHKSMVAEAGPVLPEPATRFASGSSEPEPKSPVVVPKLVVTGKSEIVARLFMRGMMPLPPATQAEFSPIFQEFFYDWILTLEPEGPTGDISIVLKEPQKHEESIKIMPDIAAVSGPTGKWMSGFQENARQNPDYYETTIRFAEGLDKDRPAKIVFRRPIKIKNEITFTLQDFSRTLEVSANKAEVVKNYYDEAKQFELISLQLKTLMGWKYSGANSPPVSVREDPNTPLPPLGRGEIETTLEVRCDNEAIGKKIVVQQMEARKKDF